MTSPWLFGGLAIAAIWVGVWWLVNAIGIPRGRPERTARRHRPHSTSWTWQPGPTDSRTPGRDDRPAGDRR